MAKGKPPKAKAPVPQPVIANGNGGAPQSFAMAAVPSDALPGDTQLHVDIHVCLLDAITDSFPVKRSDVNAKWVPSKSKAGIDQQGWGICLAEFGSYLRQLRAVYAFYVHKPQYTVDTISLPFPAIVQYLAQHVVAQIKGKE